MSSKVYRFVSNDFKFRLAVADGTSLVRQMQETRFLSPAVTLALGQTSLGAALMATHLKHGQGVGVLFRGDGPIQQLYGEAYYEGAVRAYCPNPKFQPNSAISASEIPGWIGHGTLNVVRNQPYQKSPFLGMVDLVKSNIFEDIEHYLQQSQQIPSRVDLDLQLDEQGRVVFAGGILLEIMPGVEAEFKEKILRQWDLLRDQIRKEMRRDLTSFSHTDQSGQNEKTLQQGLERHLGEPITSIPHPFQLVYFCPCTKERVMEAMKLWGEKELQQMIAEGGREEATCQLCGQVYHLNKDDLNWVLAELKKSTQH